MKIIKLIIWIIFILFITTLSLLTEPPSFLENSIEKPWIIRHILAFVVFILLTRITFPKLKWYWLVLIGLGFGLAIELLQLWLTGGVREFSLLDVGFDAVGIAVGMGIIRLGTRDKRLEPRDERSEE